MDTLIGQRLLTLTAALELLLLTAPTIELRGMETKLFGCFADTNSLGQRQPFIFEDLGMTGTVLFHQGSGSCHGRRFCRSSLNGLPLLLGKILQSNLQVAKC